MKLKNPRRLIRPAAFVLLMLSVPGCGMNGCGNDNSSGLPAAQLPAPTFGDVSIAGTVTFEGEVPERPPVHEPEEGAACPHPVPDESLVVGEDGGLQNVIVYLADAPKSSGASRPTVELKQIDCRFVPHVLAVQIGQPLTISNSDAMTHNVHYTPKNTPPVNISFDGSDRTETVSFARAESEPVGVRCDVHVWMGAYVGVFDHPFFAVTDAAGAFEIADVPPGEYTLTAWHELHGPRTQSISVGETEDVVADFIYARGG